MNKSTTIQIQYFPVVMFLMLNRMVSPFECKDKSASIQMKTTEQFFPVVLFITLYKVVLPFESVDETLKYDHSRESS